MALKGLITVFYPINEDSKKLTPLIADTSNSGQILLHRMVSAIWREQCILNSL